MRYLSNVATLQYDKSLCNGCEICTQVCPHAVFNMEGQGLTPPGLRPPSPTGEGKKGKKVKIVDRDACMECGACALNCKPGALTVDSGVGCAQAFINQALGRKGECCASDKCC